MKLKSLQGLSAAAAAILLLPLALTGQPATAAPLEAREFVEQTSDRLLQVIQQGKQYYQDDPDRFIQAILSEMTPILDMRIATKKVMGAHYAAATREQKTRFANRFRDQLVSAFAKALAEFEFEAIRVTDVRQKQGSRQAIVNMQVETRSNRVTLTYYLYQARSGDWKLYNIRVDGADLTSTYIGQFRSSMAAYRDIDKVIEHWGE